MNRLGQIPCENCPTRKRYAEEFDLLIWGNNCPYTCAEWNEWRACEKDENIRRLLRLSNIRKAEVELREERERIYGLKGSFA